VEDAEENGNLLMRAVGGVGKTETALALSDLL
jgi:hypothetical protein